MTIDIKQLRKDLAALGYILCGKHIREPFDQPSGSALDLVPTSPIEAEWALKLALDAQDGDRSKLNRVITERSIPINARVECWRCADTGLLTAAVLCDCKTGRARR